MTIPKFRILNTFGRLETIVFNKEKKREKPYALELYIYFQTPYHHLQS